MHRFTKRYEFKQVLGVGGFGYVVGVHDKTLRENIALKVRILFFYKDLHIIDNHETMKG